MLAISIESIRMEVNMEKKIWITPTFPQGINGTKYKYIKINKHFKRQKKFRKLLSNKLITKNLLKRALV